VLIHTSMRLGDHAYIGMCGRVRRPDRPQISLICAQPSGEITNGAAEHEADIARFIAVGP
jgi:hypothetical protein